MAVWDPELDAVNPFRLLADGLPAGGEMGAQTLVVVGVTGADGRSGFVLLAGQRRRRRPREAAMVRIYRITSHARRPPR